jgi:hypothetical protein
MVRVQENRTHSWIAPAADISNDVSARSLYLDDIGIHPSHERSAIRTHEGRRKVDDLQP